MDLSVEGVSFVNERFGTAVSSMDLPVEGTGFVNEDPGFVNDPVQYRSEPSGPFTPVGVDEATGEDLGLARFSRELEDAMRRTEGGSSRFGALATVLNQELAPRWKMFTPPYILLLIRTFLTLEGIAGRVDPDFNIYEMAMPWAICRS